MCDRFARCDSACREPLSSGSPQTAKALTATMVSHGLPKICSRKEHCSKGKRGSKNRPINKSRYHFAGEEQSSALTFIGSCRACPGIPKEAPNAASALPRLGPFLFGPAIYPQRKLPVYKNEQRQRARYDRLSDGCRSRPTVSKRGRDKPDGLGAQPALGPFL